MTATRPPRAGDRLGRSIPEAADDRRYGVGRRDWCTWPSYEAAVLGYREYWYPVARSRKVREGRPLPVMVCGERVMLIREQGVVHALGLFGGVGVGVVAGRQPPQIDGLCNSPRHSGIGNAWRHPLSHAHTPPLVPSPHPSWGVVLGVGPLHTRRCVCSCPSPRPSPRKRGEGGSHTLSGLK